MEPKSIDQIFWDAAQLASAAERNAYLDSACGGDVVLRRRVEQLLQARPQAENFLESVAPRSVATVQELVCERPGTVIGAYKLREPSVRQAWTLPPDRRDPLQRHGRDHAQDPGAGDHPGPD